MKKLLFVAVVVLLGATGVLLTQQGETAADRPRNVILFISDGCGPASFTFARDYLRYKGEDGLAVDAIQVGSVHTFAANSRVTDSAASATAYACGVKTNNGMLAMDTLQRPVATLLEAAEAAGMATGLVATSTMTHATPAAFSAHVPQRSMASEIAAQQLEQGIEVLFGGGVEDFLSEDQDGRRADGRNLLEEAAEKGYQVLRTRESFDGALRVPVLGLFNEGHLDYEIDRDPQQQPSLAEMTAKAIALLEDAGDGFFLMVEGSRIDHAGHANDAAAHLHDILAFDEAVAAALDYARDDGETLVVSTSDHETGGLTLGRNVDGRSMYTWNPEVVERVQHSNDYLGTQFMMGEDWEQLLREAVGIDDLSEAEQTDAAALFEARDRQRFIGLVNEMVGRRAVVGWTTGGHTAVDVNLYAFGPEHERFVGHHDNTAVGTLIADIMGFDLQAQSEAMQLEAAGSN